MEVYMKINKLDNDFFCDFASYILGVDVKLYKTDLEIKRNENNIKLRVYLGGEMEDGRKFVFKDDKCVFKNSSLFNDGVRDISYEWVKYILEYADEFSEEDRMEIVDEYNENIENEIKDYALRKRESLIV